MVRHDAAWCSKYDSHGGLFYRLITLDPILFRGVGAKQWRHDTPLSLNATRLIPELRPLRLETVSSKCKKLASEGKVFIPEGTTGKKSR